MVEQEFETFGALYEWHGTVVVQLANKSWSCLIYFLFSSPNQNQLSHLSNYQFAV